MLVNEMKKSIVREAMPKPNILQLSEYNITQKIMDSLVNPCHRAVLFSIVSESKIANQISEDLNISLSAVYKTLGKLEELTLVFVEKFEFKDGKKVKFYKSRIGNAEIALHGDDAILKLYPNKSAIDM
jgi:DNA-binding MarR family transcriptional regulator|tara:strand:- start:1010 stop:1393 length:384 start_codon:yes stop_codon:yes gene_type:complete